MKFGEKLKELRLKQNLTQDQVASAIGVSRRAYIAYEQESTRPRKQDTYDKLAETLNCDVNYLRMEDSSLSVGIYSILGALMATTVGWPAALPLFAQAGLKTISSLGSILSGSNKATYDEPVTYTNDMLFQYEKSQRKFANTAMGILYKYAAEKGLLCQHGNTRELDAIGVKPDDFIIISNHQITDWWLIFWAKDEKLDEYIIISPEDRAGVFISRFTSSTCNPKRMATIVVDDVQLYTAVCKYKGHNSYRGNLSVLLISTEEFCVISEELISTYYENQEHIFSTNEGGTKWIKLLEKSQVLEFQD